MAPSAEWLLDNFYIVEQAVRQIEEDLPADYYQHPKTPDDASRIYIIALVNTQTEETPLDLEAIRSFLQAFQEITPLTTGELWGPALDAAAGCTGIPGGRPGSPDPPNVGSSPPTPSLTPPAAGPPGSNRNIRRRAGPGRDRRQFHYEPAPAGHPGLEGFLRSDQSAGKDPTGGNPAGLYAQMDFETRNRYRSIVEELANGSPVDEVSIGRQAIRLAESAALAADGTTRAKHVGYYLIAQGRETLEAQIGFHPTFSRAVIHFLQKHATFTYLGSITALTLFVHLPWCCSTRSG